MASDSSNTRAATPPQGEATSVALSPAMKAIASHISIFYPKQDIIDITEPQTLESLAIGEAR